MPKKIHRLENGKMEDKNLKKKIKDMEPGDCFIKTDNAGKKKWFNVKSNETMGNGLKIIKVVSMFDAEESEGI